MAIYVEIKITFTQSKGYYGYSLQQVKMLRCAEKALGGRRRGGGRRAGANSGSARRAATGPRVGAVRARAFHRLPPPPRRAAAAASQRNSRATRPLCRSTCFDREPHGPGPDPVLSYLPVLCINRPRHRLCAATRPILYITLAASDPPADSGHGATGAKEESTPRRIRLSKVTRRGKH